MKPNLTLASVILAYGELRPDLLREISSCHDESSSGNSASLRSRTKRVREEPQPEPRRLAHMSFHGKPKKYVRDAVERLCKSSKVRPICDGDIDDLGKYYREIVHRNNSQIGSAAPLSLDEIVQDCNQMFHAIRKGSRADAATKAVAEKMKNGEVRHQNCSFMPESSCVIIIICPPVYLFTVQISESANSTYLKLIQSVRADKLKQREMASSSGSCDTNHQSMDVSTEPMDGEYTDGDWRIVMSERLGRPFFFNEKTQIGQFAIPVELESTALEETSKRLKASNEAIISPQLSMPRKVLKDDPDVLDLSMSDPLESDLEGREGGECVSIGVGTFDSESSICRSGEMTEAASSQGSVKNDMKAPGTSVTYVHCSNGPPLESPFSPSDSVPLAASMMPSGNHIALELRGCPHEGVCKDVGAEGSEKHFLSNCDNNASTTEDADSSEEALLATNEKRALIGGIINLIDSNSSSSGEGFDRPDSDGNVMSVADDSVPTRGDVTWTCLQCTFLNSSSTFSCDICGTNRQSPRRSQRESHLPSGTIMHGFSLTQTQTQTQTQTRNRTNQSRPTTQHKRPSLSVDAGKKQTRGL